MLITLATRFSLTALIPVIMNMECSDPDMPNEPEAPEPATTPHVQAVFAGTDHTCVVTRGGRRLRCWGLNTFGQLGQGHTMTIGDDEPASSAEDVLLPKADRVVEVAAGSRHTCARTREGRVRCWGFAPLLGVSASENLGDDEAPAEKEIDFGHAKGDPTTPLRARDIAASLTATCALLKDASTRCWGENSGGELGLGFKGETIGDDEPITDAPSVLIGAQLGVIEAGGVHFCGITVDHDVRCWGLNDVGQLGYGNLSPVGDNETPADVGAVDLGGDTILQVAAGNEHTCARTSGGRVRCWGENVYGQLGYGHTAVIGDDELPASVGYVDVDAKRAVVDIAAGAVHTCAALDDGAVKCWGYGYMGQLGYANKKTIGDDEVPASVPDVVIGGSVRRLAMGQHTCALLDSGAIRCWGINYDGQLGYGDTTLIGDDETPAFAGDVIVF